MDKSLELKFGDEVVVLRPTQALAAYASRENSSVQIQNSLRAIEWSYIHLSHNLKNAGYIIDPAIKGSVQPEELDALPGVQAYKHYQDGALTISWEEGGAANVAEFMAGRVAKAKAEFANLKRNVEALQNVWENSELLDVIQNYASSTNSRFPSQFPMQPSDELTAFAAMYNSPNGVLKKFLRLGIDPELFVGNEDELHVFTHKSRVIVADGAGYETLCEDPRGAPELHGVYSRGELMEMMEEAHSNYSGLIREFTYKVDDRSHDFERVKHDRNFGKLAINPLYFMVPELRQKLAFVLNGDPDNRKHLKVAAQNLHFPEEFFVAEEMQGARNAYLSYTRKYGADKIFELDKIETPKLVLTKDMFEAFFLRLKAMQDAGIDLCKNIQQLDVKNTDNDRFRSWAGKKKVDISEFPQKLALSA